MNQFLDLYEIPEKELHVLLFENATRYNPKVIPNMWRKMSPLDFDNLGTFAQDRCAIYDRTVTKYRYLTELNVTLALYKLNFSKQWKIRDLDKYDSLKLQNRLELGMTDYFVDSDLDDFDSSRIQVTLRNNELKSAYRTSSIRASSGPSTWTIISMII